MKDLEQFKNEMNLSGKNVYVGHRYVPKIMGEWDNTKLYEPLSIVQYQGNSFTSRQYVPIGVELTNEEYWASTGNYNAQVEYYRQEVRNLENDVNNINDEITNINDEVTAKLVQTVDYIDERGIDIKKFGAVGDGVTDDTINIQKAIDSGKKLFWSNGDYFFKNVTITKDDTHIVFGDKVTLLSDYESDHKDLPAILITGEKMEQIPITRDVEEGTNKIYLSTTTNLTTGDFLLIKQDNPIGDDLKTHRQKYLQYMARILVINHSESYIELESNIPFNFQIANFCRVEKIRPLKNLILEGNNTLFNKMGTTGYTSHIKGIYLYNAKIDGFHFTNGGGKGIEISLSKLFQVSNIKHTNPTNISAGHGYSVQISTSSNGIVENVEGYEARHIVDVSGSSCYNTVNNCYGTHIGGHGMNSKHIVIENCVAESFGMGNTSFKSDEKWTFNNCTAYNQFYVNAESSEITFNNCTVYNGTFMFNYNCENIYANNLKSLGENAKGFDIRANNVSMTNIESENATFLIWKGKNISVKNAHLSGENGFEISNGANGILLDGVAIDGDVYRAVRVLDDAYDITINNMKTDITGDQSRIIELVGMTVLTDRKIVITNSVLKSDRLQSLFVGNGGVTFINNRVSSDVLIRDSQAPVIFSNNIIEGSAKTEINTTQQTIITGNITTGNWVVPAVKEDIIVANNVVLS